MVIPEIFNDSNYFTREHIAPQNKNWDSSFYENPDTINKLGTITFA